MKLCLSPSSSTATAKPPSHLTILVLWSLMLVGISHLPTTVVAVGSSSSSSTTTRTLDEAAARKIRGNRQVLRGGSRHSNQSNRRRRELQDKEDADTADADTADALPEVPDEEENDKEIENPTKEGVSNADSDNEVVEDEDDEETAPSKKESSKKDSKGAEGGADRPQTRSGGPLGPSKRDCTTDQKKDGRVDFECNASEEDELSEIKDKLKFKIDARSGDALRIGVEYRTSTENVTTGAETETKTKYTLVYDRIIEYRKVGDATDDHYEWGIDEVVKTWAMDSWEQLTPVETDGNLLTFSATDGVASFTFTIAQAESLNITANKMKIDFLLENYPWDASGDTFVALISHVETKRKTKVKGAAGPAGGPGAPSDESRDPQLDLRGQDLAEDVAIDFQDATEAIGFVPVGEYSWAKTAEASSSAVGGGTNDTDLDLVDDLALMERQASNMTEDMSTTMSTTTIDVIASTSPDVVAPDGSTYKEIAFSFVGAAQGADRIFWDPEAGVGYQESSAATAARFWGSLLTVMGTASVAAMLVVAI